MKTKFVLLSLFSLLLFSSASATNPILNLKVFLEGFYSTSTGTMRHPLSFCGPDDCDTNHCDYLIIYLYDENCNEVQKEIGVLNINGNVTVYLGSILPLSNITLGNNYWIRVTHRNHVDVWSSSAVQINSTSTNYDFTTSAGSAYGSNQADLGIYMGNHVWGMFTGDIYHDCQVDGTDYLLWDIANQNGVGGYVVEDLNGDCAVDGSDYLILDPNIQNGVGCASPCGVDPCTVQFRKSSKSNPVENQLQLSVIPNPASDLLTVVTNMDGCDLKIINAIGEVVYMERMNFQTSFQVSKYPKGIYYLTIERNGKIEGKRKIAIQ